MSLLAKITLLPVTAVVLLGAGLAWQINVSYKSLELHEVEEQARFLARTVQAVLPAYQDDARGPLEETLKGIAASPMERGTTVFTITVLDREGRVRAQYKAPETPSGRVIQARIDSPAPPSGNVIVAVSDGHVDYELGWHEKRIWITTALIVFLAVVITGVLMRKTIQPAVTLVRAVRAVDSGDFASRVAVTSRDEIGELAKAFNDMLGALQRKHQENLQLRRRLFLAQEEERRRVATELHDHTGQALTSLIAGLAVLKNSARHEQTVADLLSLAAHALHDVHDLSRTLRPAVLQHIGLVPALRQLCEHMGANAGLKIDFSAIGFDDDTRLPTLVELALYRIAQEAITNAVRHGRAENVEVLLQRKDRGVLAVVEDNGIGFDAEGWRQRCLGGAHLGLLSIEERAVLLGGTLRVESFPGRGTSLFIDIPLVESPHAQN